MAEVGPTATDGTDGPDGVLRVALAELVLGALPALVRARHPGVPFYLAGKSMSEMAAENGISEEELIAFLEAQVDEGLDAFVAAGAFSTELRDAMDAKASEAIAWGVDYHQGDPLPEGAERAHSR